jgi:hypothetical protein
MRINGGLKEQIGVAEERIQKNKGAFVKIDQIIKISRNKMLQV